MVDAITIEQQQESRAAALAWARQQTEMLQNEFATQQDMDAENGNGGSETGSNQQKGAVARTTDAAKKIAGTAKALWKSFKDEIKSNMGIVIAAFVFEIPGLIPVIGIAFNWLFSGIVVIYFYIKKSGLTFFEVLILNLVVDVATTLFDAFFAGLLPASIVLILVQIFAIAVAKVYKEFKNQLSENLGVEIPEEKMAGFIKR